MFPGAGGRGGGMEKMMKQMGMEMEDVPAKRVTVETEDGDELVFESPELSKIEVQGQTMFQLQGDYEERSGQEEDDLALIMEKTGASEEDARQALEEHDDLTDAIMSVSD